MNINMTTDTTQTQASVIRNLAEVRAMIKRHKLNDYIFSLIGLLALTLLLLVLPAGRAIFKIGPPEPGDARPRFLRIPPLGLALLAGPLLTLLHSLADLPFRSPAILWLWAAMLACAADLCERTEPRHRHRRHAEEDEPAGDDPDERKEPA